VCDTANNRVLYYPAGSTTASVVYGQGSSGTNFAVGAVNAGGSASSTTLSGPAAAVLDAHGNLYVADYGNNRVLLYPAGAVTATIVTSQHILISFYPVALALDSANHLFIADSSNNYVLLLPAGGSYPSTEYEHASFSGAVGVSYYKSPWGVVVDSAGGLYISDSGNNRVLFIPAGSNAASRVIGQF